MAVSVNVTKRSMNLLINNGVDANGTAVTKAYAFNNVKPEAAPEKIMAAGMPWGLCMRRTWQASLCLKRLFCLRNKTRPDGVRRDKGCVATLPFALLCG